MRDAVIVGAVRTAIARENGALRDVPPEVYAALVLREAISRSAIDPGMIDEVILGHCLGAPGCMARVAALKAGLAQTIPALTVDRQCGSGSTALQIAATFIQARAGDVYLAGGVEGMTRAPYLLEKPRTAFQRVPAPWIQRRPLAPEEVGDPPMGITAENVADCWEISREEQDEFALNSQKKATRAITHGRFREQIVPVAINGTAGPISFDTDEHPRSDLTLAALANLEPTFLPDGSITAGNSCGVNDAAAAMVVVGADTASGLGLRPLVTVRAFAAVGVDPMFMGIGPVAATQKALARAGLSIGQMDVIELNESFAAQAIACCRDLGIDWHDEARFNPNGGAIALGHPIAATLAILVVKAIYELRLRDGRYALVTACCGGGQGVATILER
jgi:acetyl-CoA C-acetyltransferase